MFKRNNMPCKNKQFSLGKWDFTFEILYKIKLPLITISTLDFKIELKAFCTYLVLI